MSWWKTSIKATQFLSLDPAADSGELLFVAPQGMKGGKVWRMEYGTTDDSQPIECRWTSPHHDMRAPDMVKPFHQVGVDVDDIAGGITFTWEVDHGAAGGSMLLQKPGRYQWGDSSRIIRRWKWNNAAGSRQGGMRWTTRKRGEYIVNLPDTARGRTIQIAMESISGVTMKVVAYQIIFSREGSTEPGTEATN